MKLMITYDKFRFGAQLRYSWIVNINEVKDRVKFAYNLTNYNLTSRLFL